MIFGESMLYHIVNLLIILFISVAYTLIKEQVKKNRGSKGISKEHRKLSEHNFIAFASEVFKNFLVGAFVYAIYIFYQNFKN